MKELLHKLSQVYNFLTSECLIYDAEAPKPEPKKTEVDEGQAEGFDFNDPELMKASKEQLADIGKKIEKATTDEGEKTTAEAEQRFIQIEPMEVTTEEGKEDHQKIMEAIAEKGQLGTINKDEGAVGDIFAKKDLDLGEASEKGEEIAMKTEE